MERLEVNKFGATGFTLQFDRREFEFLVGYFFLISYGETVSDFCN